MTKFTKISEKLPAFHSPAFCLLHAEDPFSKNCFCITMAEARQALSVQQKQRILAENKRKLSAQKNCSQNALAQWAKDEFKLDAIANLTMIFCLLKKADNFKNISLFQSVSFKKTALRHGAKAWKSTLQVNMLPDKLEKAD